MAVFKCKMCGASLEAPEGASVATCEYCDSQQTLPRLNDEKITRLYEMANLQWRNKSYDKAMGFFESILLEDNSDAEIYWSMVLCRYGIEYVEDPKTKKRIPTINRTQYTSILADADYKAALEHADLSQKLLYQEEAKEIDKIQQRILALSQKEDPFDVFICYKETDDSTQRRTADSVIGAEIYQRLTREKLRVFFSRHTLEDKFGEEYEPYIFSALNSAKVMIVIGTRLEYINAPWVKNEWSRYHALIKNGDKKVMFTAYRDIDPYDFPEELAVMQGLNLDSLGFMEDLVHAVTKIVNRESKVKPVKQQSDYTANDKKEALLKRASIFLDNYDWNSAAKYCEKVLDLDPENANAYILKLMAILQVSKEKDISRSTKALEEYADYKNAIRFADSETAERLKQYNDIIKENIAKAEEAERIRKEEEAQRSAEERRLRALKEAEERAKKEALCKAKNKWQEAQNHRLTKLRKQKEQFESERYNLNNARAVVYKKIEETEKEKPRVKSPKTLRILCLCDLSCVLLPLIGLFGFMIIFEISGAFSDFAIYISNFMILLCIVFGIPHIVLSIMISIKTVKNGRFPLAFCMIIVLPMSIIYNICNIITFRKSVYVKYEKKMAQLNKQKSKIEEDGAIVEKRLGKTLSEIHAISHEKFDVRSVNFDDIEVEVEKEE